MEIHHEHFDKIDSTNTWAKQHAASFPRDKLTLVTAGEQTEGRGRLGREWISPAEENVYASFCFFIDNDRDDFGNISQVMGITSAEVIEELWIRPQLKWPNDILIKGKKVGGILCETVPVGDQRCVIVGIGLNVNMPEHELQQIDRPATSMMIESEGERQIEVVLDHLSKRFVLHLEQYLAEGFSPFLTSYRELLHIQPGEPVQFHDPRQLWKGLFKKIQDDGSLTLELESGEDKTFHSGEVL